jgi:hypothetical protein
MTTATETPVTLINLLTVAPERQQELVALLRENTETVITTLKGWIATSLIPSADGTRVVIHSQWDGAADVAAMRPIRACRLIFRASRHWRRSSPSWAPSPWRIIAEPALRAGPAPVRLGP